MTIDKKGDTRDLVIELATRFEILEKRVVKNSAILDRLEDYVTEARGGKRVVLWAYDAGKLLLAGASGAGLWPWIQSHLPHTVLALALMVAMPARAGVDGAEGWVLELEACAADCQTWRIDLGGTAACARLAEDLIEAIRSAPLSRLGYPPGTTLKIGGRCIAGPAEA